MRIILVSLLALGAAVSGSCRDTPAATSRVDVVAALFPIAEVVRAIGGDAVRVTDLTPPGVEPHDFELKPSDVDRIQDADLVVVIGNGFQPAIEKAARRRDGATLTLLSGGEADPHVWLDPVAMRAVSAKLVAALGARRRPDEARFAHRQATLDAQLEALDRDFRAGLASCRIRTIVAAHDAFGHLARRYHLEHVGIAGLDPAAEPSPARVDEVARIVKAKAVTTIFTETLVSPAVAQALAREAGVTTAVLDPLESGQPGSYFGGMRRNLAVLRGALGCS